MHPCSLQDPDQHAQAFLAAQPQIEPGASSISQQHCQPYTAYPIGHIQDDQGKSCKLTRIEQRASALPLRPDHPHMQQYRQTLLSQPDAALQRAYCQQQFGQHMTNQQQQETKQALMLAQYSGADICQASLLMALTCMVLLLLLLLAASQQRCKHCGGVPTGPIGSDTHHHTFDGDMHAWRGLITALSGWAATAAAKDAVSSSCADASISSCKVGRDSSRIQRKMMPTVSRKLLQVEVGASTRPQSPDVPASAAAAKGTNEQDLAAIAALKTLAADATAASAVMLKALPRIWVQAYSQQQQQHKQLQAQQTQSAVRASPPEVWQVVAAAAGVPVSAAPVSQASNSGSSSPGSSTKGVATLPAAVTTAQLPALGTSSTIHGSSSSSSGAGGDGEPQVVAYTSPPSITTATPVSGSSSSSSSTGGSSSTSSSSISGGGEPRVVTYTGPPSTAAVTPITESSSTVSSTGSGIQISTSTPVTVINPINVTTPLSQTTVQQSGDVLGAGVGEALVVAAALRPRLVVVPVFLPGG